MSGLNYKELQEKCVFDVPHKAFLFMQEQQAKINELQKKINNVNEVLSKANIKDDRFSLEFALNEIEELLK